MLRVILADDEPWIIKGLKKMIDWPSYSMEIVGQASDGQELMNLIETQRPDIVISDISMPHMTGIEIIKKIKENNLPIKVIFISAYQDFNYARDAVTYGAVDYIVKPVEKSKLDEVLHKTIDYFNERQEEEIRKGKLQHLEHKNRDKEIQEILALLARGKLSAQANEYRLAQQWIQYEQYCLGIIELDYRGNRSERWTDHEAKLVEFAIGNILQEVVVSSGIGHVFMKNNRYVYLSSEVTKAEIFAHDILEKIRSFLKLNVSIGISAPVNELLSLSAAYGQAEQALERKFFDGLNDVYVYKPAEQKQSLEQQIYNCQQEVIRNLTSRLWEEAKASLTGLFDTIRLASYPSRSLTLAACFSSVMSIMQALTKTGALSSAAIDMHELQNKLEEYETYEELKAEIIRVLNEFHLGLNDQAGNQGKLLMAKVVQYIHDHYNEEITLESVASIAFMNPYYFSSFFKKHTKTNFKQYVTDIRMKEAVRLLTQTDMMIYEIAEQVGYTNARHFSDMFKKHIGKVPNDYRQDARG